MKTPADSLYGMLYTYVNTRRSKHFRNLEVLRKNVPSLEPFRVDLASADFCRQTLKTVVIVATIVKLNDGFYCAKTLK